MHIEYRAEFRCRPHHLWPLLDDADKQRLWLTTLVDLVPTSPMARTVGATFDMRVREGRRIAHYEGRINAYEPSRHLGVSFWGGALGPGVVMTVDYRLADLGTRTRLEYIADIDTASLPGPMKLAIPLARVFTFFQLRYYMRNLRRLAESTAHGSAERNRA
jgi:hypothetical protein